MTRLSALGIASAVAVSAGACTRESMPPAPLSNHPDRTITVVVTSTPISPGGTKIRDAIEEVVVPWLTSHSFTTRRRHLPSAEHQGWLRDPARDPDAVFGALRALDATNLLLVNVTGTRAGSDSTVRPCMTVAITLVAATDPFIASSFSYCDLCSEAWLRERIPADLATLLLASPSTVAYVEPTASSACVPAATSP